MIRHVLYLSLLGLCLVLVGCGSESEDAATNLSGKVTFNGQPVPRGTIYFDPDAARDNLGAQGFATIENGLYDTSSGGRGAPRGPVVVRIQGFATQEQDRPLFLHEERIDLGAGASTHNFNVPASAARNVPRSVGPPP